MEKTMNILERVQTKHNAAADDVTKLRSKRDKALDILIRAEARYRKAIKSVTRTQKRLDKVREEARAIRAARAARKQTEAETFKPALSAEDVLGI
jgi:FtsZ-binding cell division protein ZapB